jgi:hypothetical protein
MENYKNARDLLKKHLFDKLMCERFGWEIRVGNNLFVIDTALDKEENEEKIKIVEDAIRHMIYELDTYLFHIEVDHDYQNIPTIFHLLQMSIEFDDTPIDEADVYDVDEASINRKPDYDHFNKEVWKAVEKLADHDKGEVDVL